MMNRKHHGTKEGLIPTALGTVVTAGAVAARCMQRKEHKISKKNAVPMIETALIGFGLAHVVLGAIDLIQD